MERYLRTKKKKVDPTKLVQKLDIGIIVYILHLFKP